jgi:hypothetical protein
MVEKKDNRLDDSSAFQIMEVNRGSFRAWNTREIS